MNLKDNINGRAFIFENVLEEPNIVLQNVIQQCKEQEISQHFLARMHVRTRDCNFSFALNKEFIECTDTEKFIFSHSDLLDYSKVELLRKDSDFSLDPRLMQKLEEIILTKVKEIYSDIKDEIKIEHSGVIKYGIGYKMDTHRDLGNNRVCTAVLYLNSKEDNNGGDLIFYEEDEVTELYKYSPIKNDLIIFDSHLYSDTLAHSVDATVDWERYVFRIYFKI